MTDSALGESDIVVIYGNKLAILIENKIDATVQPDQGLRYKERGNKGIEKGLWEKFVTCMVAPKLYLQKEQDAGVYGASLSYEEIFDWFSSRGTNDRRSAYRGYLIKEAIEQNRRGYTINPDERVTEFWSKYWTLAAQQYPDLEMKKPGLKPANSDWPMFYPPLLGKDLAIVHKLDRGDVDLEISGAASKIDELKANFADIKDVEVVKAGKSAAIRIKVGRIDRFVSFESQKDIVIDGLNAARKLLDISHSLVNEI